MSTELEDRTIVDASTVRQWARAKGFTVGERGHLPQPVIDAYNRRHRIKGYLNGNPWSGSTGRSY